MNEPVEIIKNRHGIYLYYREASIESELGCLSNILSTIADSLEYCLYKKQKLTETLIHDYINLKALKKTE